MTFMAGVMGIIVIASRKAERKEKLADRQPIESH